MADEIRFLVETKRKHEAPGKSWNKRNFLYVIHRILKKGIVERSRLVQLIIAQTDER